MVGMKDVALALWPDGLPPGSAMTFWSLDNKEGSHLRSLDEIPAMPQENYYFGVCSRVEGLTRFKQGNTSECTALPAVWIDLDTADGVHASSKLPSRKIIEPFIEKMQPPASIIVDSGGGYHAYWLLDSALDLTESAETARKGRALAKAWQKSISDLLKGFHVDQTGSIPRIMRAPGSYNKRADRKVKVLRCDPSVRYSVEELVAAGGLNLAPRKRKAQKDAVGGDIPVWRLRQALKYLPRDYDTWLKVGMALKLAGEQYFAEWSRWSYVKDDTEREYKWETFSTEIDDDSVTVASIWGSARRRGWRPTPIHRTEAGQAEILRWQYGDSVRWSPGIGWMLWRGNVWEVVDQTQIAELVLGLSYEQAIGDFVPPDRQHISQGEQEAWTKHGISFQSSAKVTSVLKLFKVGAPVFTDATDIDADEHLLNVKNGVIDLRSGDLLPPSRDRIITSIIDIDYDPMAKAPRWGSFIEEIFLGDEELIGEARLALGYTITGDNSEEVLFLARGVLAGNGKSTLLETLATVLGTYSVSPNVEGILTGAKARERAYVSLLGKRLAIYQEPPERAKLDATMLKAATGGDTVEARYLYREPIHFEVKAKIWISCNQAPAIDGDDRGIARRMMVLPFDYVPLSPDRRLKKRLQGESAGILAWLVEAARAFYAQGLRTKRMRMHAQNYLKDNDIVGEWIRGEVETGTHEHTDTSELYSAFDAWCRRNGYRALNRKQWASKVKSYHGWEITQRKGAGGKRIRAYRGVRILKFLYAGA